MICRGAEKAPAVRGRERKERPMNLVTRFELAAHSESELKGLYRKIFNALARSTAGSAERRSALASLESIIAELNARAPHP